MTRGKDHGVRGRTTACLLAALLLLVLAACSGHTDGEQPARRPGAAEPAGSPVLSAQPAGTVVPLGPGAEGMAFDDRTGLLAVAVRNPDRLLLVDGATGRTVRSVRLPGDARHVQLAGPGGPVLVPAESADMLVEVTLPDGAASEIPVGRSPHDAAEVAGGQILVTDELGGALSLVSHGRVIHTFRSQTQPGGVTAVGNLAGVVDVRDFTVSTYDVRRQQQTGVLSAGDGPTHLVTDARGRLIVADTRGNAMIVYTVTPLRRAATMPLAGAPYGLAYDRRRQLLWVTLTADNQVVALSTAGATLREVARLPTIRQPNTVAVDPGSGRVFVSSPATGQLELIDPPA